MSKRSGTLRSFFSSSSTRCGSSSSPPSSSAVCESPGRVSSSSSNSDSSDSAQTSGLATGKCVKVSRRTRTFKKRWLRQYQWLQWEKEGMFCKTCREMRKKNSFTSRFGCKNFRTSTLTRHAQSGDHKSANQEAVMRRDFATATQRVLSKNEAAVLCAFKAIYWLAKEEIASSKFPSLLALLQMLGTSDIGNLNVGANATYTHHSSVAEMQDVIDECIQSSIVEQIRSCSAYGLMVDESTDVTITKKLVIYVKIVNQCHTKTCFLANIDIVDGRAETIYDTILNWAGERNISLDRCVGFGSDGASVMVGIRSGVATRLKTLNPFIVSVHCAAHRLALTTSQAAKEMAYLSKFMEMLHTLFTTIFITLQFVLLNFIKFRKL